MATATTTNNNMNQHTITTPHHPPPLTPTTPAEDDTPVTNDTNGTATAQLLHSYLESTPNKPSNSHPFLFCPFFQFSVRT